MADLLPDYTWQKIHGNVADFYIIFAMYIKKKKTKKKKITLH